MTIQNVLLVVGAIAGYKLTMYLWANRSSVAALLKAYLTKLEAQNKSASNPLLGNKPQPVTDSGGLLTNLTKNPLILIGLAVGGTLLATKVDFKQVISKLSLLTATGVAVVKVPEPTAEYKQLAAPLAPVVTGKPGARDLASFYVAAADVLERDTENKIDTSGRLTAWFVDAGTLAYGSSTYVGSFPGWQTAMSEIIKNTLRDANTVGDEEIGLSPDKKTKMVSVLKACAWTCQQ